MRVTFLLPNINLRGGIRSTLTLAEHLARRGHDVSIFTRKEQTLRFTQKIKSFLKGNSFRSEVKVRDTQDYVHLISVPVRNVGHSLPWRADDLPDADVVIATWWADAEGFIDLPPSKGVKMYFIRHHEIHDYLPIDRVKATYQLPVYKITTARWLVEVMQSEYQAKYVFVVPNSVDTTLFNAPVRHRQPEPTVGVMYSTTTWKGCDISLKAFELASKRIPHLKLVSFGSDQVVPDMPLPQGTKFFYKPEQTMIKDIYASCDAWLFGSRVEGFGLPLLEAMACRTPVIGTPAGAAPELLADGRGILVKPEDPEDMARAIETIYQLSDTAWQQMSTAAYEHVVQYTWADAAALLEQAMSTAIADSQLPVPVYR